MRNDREMVDQLGPPFANRARGERIRARKRNLSHGAEIFGSEEAQRATVGGETQNGYLVRRQPEILADQFHGADKRDWIAVALLGRVVGPLFQFADVFAGHPPMVL